MLHIYLLHGFLLEGGVGFSKSQLEPLKTRSNSLRYFFKDSFLVVDIELF